ncbi:hypothetical protein T11_12128 [Trichinella zimbabwensis]|uniref:Uncharacterized protein n=1 Tax=Trichinella zimbabwensis TaxID=268475 RepID=A0A0V1H4D2_9BILA|nr:hypothetical protein T11_12128 [Trichinella zimbabwensis]
MPYTNMRGLSLPVNAATRPCLILQGAQPLTKPLLNNFLIMNKNLFLSKASSPAEAQFGKSGNSNPVPGFGKVALNGQDQGCFEITNKFRRIKLDAKFFRFGMEHLKYPAIRWDNLKGLIPELVVTLSQQPQTSLGSENQYIIGQQMIYSGIWL